VAFQLAAGAAGGCQLIAPLLVRLASQLAPMRWSVLTPRAERPGPGASHSQRLTLLTSW
jgi:hypothetical protein